MVTCILVVFRKQNALFLDTKSYHAEIKEQNSGENWSDGAEGGGLPTIACRSS